MVKRREKSQVKQDILKAYKTFRGQGGYLITLRMAKFYIVKDLVYDSCLDQTIGILDVRFKNHGSYLPYLLANVELSCYQCLRRKRDRDSLFSLVFTLLDTLIINRQLYQLNRNFLSVSLGCWSHVNIASLGGLVFESSNVLVIYRQS